MNLKQVLCKHKTYIITKCNKDDRYYLCKCKCGYEFDKPKAIGEMYDVGITRKEDITI